MASGLSDEQVEMMMAEHEVLLSMLRLRDQLSHDLGSLCFNIHLQHSKLQGYFNTPMLRLAFLAWADRNMVSEDIPTRRHAQAIRQMLDRNNNAPLFADQPSDIVGS